MCESTNYRGDMSIGKKPECMVLREDCERLAKMVDAKEATIKTLEEWLDLKNGYICDLIEKLSKAEKTIERKEEAIGGLTNELKAQDKRFAKERDDFMGCNERLHEKCQMLTDKLEDRNAFVDALHKKMNQMDEDLRAKDEEIENLKKMINCIYGTGAFKHPRPSDVIGVLRDITADTDGVTVNIELSPEAATVLYYKGSTELLGRLLHVDDLIECGMYIKEPEFMKKEVFSPGDRKYDEIAQDFRKKYEALLRAGFNSDQAMQFLPMWWDEEEEE